MQKKEGNPLKRLLAVLLLLALLPVGCVSPAQAKSSAKPKATAKPQAAHKYIAYVFQDTPLRKSIADRTVLESLKKNTKVYVDDVGEKWSRVSYRKYTGYVRTNKLVRFFSLDPENCPVPGRTVNAGIVTLSGPVRITGGAFPGMTAKEGAMLCVRKATESDYKLAVWRGSGKIPLSSGEYRAFTAWDAAQPGDLIGGFTTYYHSKYGAPLEKNRAHNITLACKRIHNDVIQPGKSYSFNRHCAPFSGANGYQKAHTIGGPTGTSVGYGGGVCQLSTTLYNAVLGLPLLVNEMMVHRERGVKYIPQWFDSAVGAYSDLKFTNTLPYPIRLWAAPQGGALTVLIYRAGNLWPEITED